MQQDPPHPLDDPSVEDDHDIWRRVHPSQIVYDSNLQRSRATSGAFQDSGDGSPTSVLIAKMVLESGRSATDVLTGIVGEGVVRIAAGDAREKGILIHIEEDDGEKAHAYLVGKKTRSVQNHLAGKAVWVIPGQPNR